MFEFIKLVSERFCKMMMLIHKYYWEVDNLNNLLTDVYEQYCTFYEENSSLKGENENLKVEVYSIDTLKEYYETKVKEDQTRIDTLQRENILVENKRRIEVRRFESLEGRYFGLLADFERVKQVESKENQKLSFKLAEERKDKERLTNTLSELKELICSGEAI